MGHVVWLFSSLRNFGILHFFHFASYFNAVEITQIRRLADFSWKKLSAIFICPLPHYSLSKRKPHPPQRAIDLPSPLSFLAVGIGINLGRHARFDLAGKAENHGADFRSPIGLDRNDGARLCGGNIYFHQQSYIFHRNRAGHIDRLVLSKTGEYL